MQKEILAQQKGRKAVMTASEMRRICQDINPDIISNKFKTSVELIKEANFYLNQLFKTRDNVYRKLATQPYGAAV